MQPKPVPSPENAEDRKEREGFNMMNYIEKVGNIKVYSEQNGANEYTITFINGTDIVAQTMYSSAYTKNEAIAHLFSVKFDTHTEEWLWLNIPTSDLEVISDNLFKSGNDYFKRIDDTRYFKHFDHKPMM